MSNYIYTMYEGADPGAGWIMNDPILGKKPSLGSCVPNVRRNVQIGDWIFVISGRVKHERQYVVGGFQVAEKIHQLEALKRFPDLAVRKDEEGRVHGNIIVNPDGSQIADDNHAAFERRLENYIVGKNPIELVSPAQVQQGRAETLAKLSEIFGREGNRPFDIIGRARTLDQEQAAQMRAWLDAIKSQHP